MSTFVTANLGRSAGPSTTDWVRAAMAARTFGLCLQEIPSRRLIEQVAEDYAYRAVWPVDAIGRQPTSGVLLSPEVVAVDLPPNVVELATPFASYVVVTGIEVPGVGPTVLSSFHASPGALSNDVRTSWPWELRPPRRGSKDGRWVRHMGETFYSDALVELLRLLGVESRMPVLAGGDLNEAREWDLRNEGESWGDEIFAAIADAQLQNLTWNRWKVERRTRFHRAHPGYQLDYFFACEAVAGQVECTHVDTGWTSPDQVESEQRSDHAPVWLELRDH